MKESTGTDERASSDIYNSQATDGLQNVISGLGTAKARDPYSTLAANDVLDRTELEDIYRHYWIAKAVDIKPWDMTREWRTFDCQDADDSEISKLEELERKLNIREICRQALIWASVYGGGAIVMHVNGHGDMDKPLDPYKIKTGQLDRLSAVDRWNLIEFSPIDYNPISPDYGTAEWYYIANDTNFTKIHRSRILFFRGRKMPVRIERQLKVWGDSDIQRWYKAITNMESASSGILEGIHQANIDVVAVNGLANLLAQKDGDSKAIKRFLTMDQCKSMLNMSVIDAEDTFTRNAFPFSGLPDIYRVFLDVLSAATDIPVTRLLGSSPGGLNATGESDARNYYDMIKSRQINYLDPVLYTLDQVLVRSALGDYPDGISYEWNSLWQMTEKERADLMATQVQSLAQLSMLGVPEYALHKDAIELGLVKSYTIEDVEQAEREDDFDIDPENDDFDPRNHRDQGEEEESDNNIARKVDEKGRQ